MLVTLSSHRAAHLVKSACSVCKAQTGTAIAVRWPQFVGAVLISVHVEAMLGACYYHYKCAPVLLLRQRHVR